MPDEGDLVIGCFMDGRDAQHPIVFGVINTAKFSLPAVGGASLPPYSMGTTGNYPVDTGRAVNTSLESHQRAFLDAIASKESAGKYDVLNGGGTFDTSGNHPNIVGPGGTSTAAGRYQFTYGTWKDVSGGAPMTPVNQDYYAWELAKRRYKAYTGGDLNSYIKTNGVTSELLTSLAPTWEAFADPNNHNAIISTFNKSLQKPDETSYDIGNVNPYLASSQDAHDNYGTVSMPYQFHGEGIDKSPIVTQATFRKTTQFGDHTIEEPLRPIASNVRTSVWQARQYGSNIELAGKTDDNEFISITHVSGSHVTLDSHGNVTIKSFGSSHNSSEGNMEEVVTGSKLSVYGTGYGILVQGGKCVIQAEGDMEFQSGGDFSITSGGRVTINAGDSIDIAGSRIAATARVDNIDLLSIGKLSLEAKAGNIGIKASKKVAVESTDGIDMKTGEFVKIGGSEIHLNSPGQAPGSAEVAIAANVPAAIARGVSSDTDYESSTSQANPITPDLPGELT
jgi:muramidase (phage lysozyme)